MLGLGAGWHEPEHRAFGYELLVAGRSDQPVRRGEPGSPAGCSTAGRSTFDGRWVSGARDAQRPAAGPGADAAVDRRAAASDGCSGSSPATPTSGTARATRRRTPTRARCSTRHCAELGRDPPTIRRTVGVQPVCIRDTREAAVDALAAILAASGRRSEPGTSLGGELAAGRYRRTPSSACSAPGARPAPRRPSSTCPLRSTTRRSSVSPDPFESGSA